ncbi:MAG: quercetin dioxygenase-like cupin family protein, partial [Saprospiraceae bacterium]
TYVQGGEFEMTIGEDIRIIKGGDSYYIPPFVMHGCVCKKDGKLIDVFSPHREDFLE